MCKAEIKRINEMFFNDIIVEFADGLFVVYFKYREDEWDAGSWYETRRWRPRTEEITRRFLRDAIERRDDFYAWAQNMEVLP